MFSYYGSKSKIVDYYPPPKHKRIIEPFAGSARYSLKYWQNDVLIAHKYEVIITIWKWLQQCSKNDIMKFQILKRGDDIRTMNLTIEESYWVGLIINQGTNEPKNVVTEYSAKGLSNFIKRTADNLFKIKHWEIRHSSYEDLENIEATWFIDPPYQFGGEHYKEPSTNIDFKELGEWCKNRNGQAIVCENTKADWLPFRPMVEMQGTMFRTTEAIWSNHKTNYDAVQQSLQF